DGELLAAEWIAERFRELGLSPLGDDYLDRFEFISGVQLGEGNSLRSDDYEWRIGQDFRPLSFSARGGFESAPTVFVGYGIVAPAVDGESAYDSYQGVDVRRKWVLMLRDAPTSVTDSRRRHLERFSMLRLKASAAREKGAKGILVASGYGAEVDLIPLSADASNAGSGLAALSVSDAVADTLLRTAKTTIAELKAGLDTGEMQKPIALQQAMISSRVELLDQNATGRNVIGLLPGQDPSLEPVLVGAHYDGQGRGESGNSLARTEEAGEIHPGADDNASGVAALLEIARLLGEGGPRLRSVVFAAWSGEELGLLGSAHWAKSVLGEPGNAKRKLLAALNLDMVGRMEKVVVLNGTGSSSSWLPLIETLNVGHRLPILSRASSYLPTDATSFYVRGVPVLSAFTGAH
ncbi:MAG: M20/M25/M40 family metallo-hydrolase, partial [Myxococcota bacterium]